MADDDDLDGVPIAEPAAAGPWAAVPVMPPQMTAPISFVLGGGAPAAAAVAHPHPLPPSVDAVKLARFDAGAAPSTLAQTPYAKRQAEAEAKRKRAEEEAANEYAQFVNAFNAGPSASSSSSGGSGGGKTGASASRRGGPPAGRPGLSLIGTHKAFVSGGVIGGDLPASAATSASASSSASAAAASSTAAIAAPAYSRGGPPVAAGARPTDPAALRAGLPSTAAPPRANPFAFQSSSPAFSAAHPTAASGSGSGSSGVGGMAGAFSLDADAPPQPVAKRRKVGEGKRNMDTLLDELKQADADRALGIVHPRGGGGDRSGGGGGGVDMGDPTSTNLYVNSLPVDITERRLAEMFARYGDVASVKIMWPRGGEGEHSKSLHCGFVSFMRREDAVRALDAMHNQLVQGNALKLNWSKSVAIPPRPYMLALAPGQNGNNGGGGPTNSYGSASASSSSGPTLYDLDSFNFPPNAVKYQVELPSDPLARRAIDTVALHALEAGLEQQGGGGGAGGGGVEFEQALMERAARAEGAAAEGDGLYAFLLHPTSLEHLYYRWRLYSLAQGDTLERWRRTPLQLVAGGPFIIPPDWARGEQQDLARRKERREKREAQRAEKRRAERGADSGGKAGGWDHKSSTAVVPRPDRGKLSPSSLSTLTELLRSVSTDRVAVREVMGWCLDHSDASKEVVEVIAEALTLEQTQVQKKIARLYVVSDILHNSSAPIPHASSYRSLFQSCLPSIFASMHRAHTRAAAEMGRMTADAIRNKVQLLFRAWSQWALFPHTFIQQLEDIFTKGDTAAEHKAAAAAGSNGAATTAV